MTAVWVSNVQPTTARLNAEIDPNGKQTSYHFAYLTRAAYDANVGGGNDGFQGAARSPGFADAILPVTTPTSISPTLFGLAPDTAYRYRLVAKNADGTTFGPARDLRTFPSGTPFALPDDRGWEMVSPVDKNGGQVSPAGALAGGGVLQATPDGEAVTYGSAASFAGGGAGAGVASQYLSTRGASGWSTLNLTPPLLSGSYGSEPTGTAYQLFSPGLERGLLLNGRPCRGGAAGCPVANPPLAGTGAPAGYQNYYLRDGGGSFEALLEEEVAQSDLDPSELELRFTGSSPDLRHIVLSTCAALTPGAGEAPLGEGCDPAQPNLYLWSGGGLALVNGPPGAVLGAQAGAISADGARVYFHDLGTGNLYLREGSSITQVDAAAGGGGTFETATPDGSSAYFTKAGHLWSYRAATDTATDLTPSGDVLGVLGVSATGSYLYYLTSAGLFLRQGAATIEIADGADASNYPPASGTARLSADGTRLLFASTVPLQTSDGSIYDNLDLDTKAPTSQLYLYDAGAGSLTCVSCNPTFSRPVGPSSVPGAIANGKVPGSTQAYKPRVFSSDGRRILFDTEDSLVLSDVNLGPDVYQWEAQGKGSCARPGGCISLISAGLAGDSSFVDASVDGDDAFFIADRSLVGMDPDAVDLYDARVGGGFAEPGSPSPCNGDACQSVPPPVEDPVLTTVLPGPGNPGERYRSYGAQRRKCPPGKALRTVKRKDGKRVRKCVKLRSGSAGKSGRDQ